MTVKEALLGATKRLSKSKSSSPYLDAEVLLAFTINRPKEFIFANPEAKLSPKQAVKFQGLVSKRVLGRPVAYLTGIKSFYGLDIFVNENVLIPRPLTEELVAKADEYLKGHKGLKVLDIGTGSGAVIVSLAKSLGPRHKYFASDISSPALAVAKMNAGIHKVKVNFKKNDLLKNWDQDFDVVVANLPYLHKVTDPSIKFEPKSALVSPDEGNRHYSELFKQLGQRKKKPSRLFLEMHVRQRKKMLPLLTKHLPDAKATIAWDTFSK